MGLECEMSKIPTIEGDLLVGMAKTVGVVEAMQLAQFRDQCEGLSDRQLSWLLRAAMAVWHMPRDADKEAVHLMFVIDELRKAWLNAGRKADVPK